MGIIELFTFENFTVVRVCLAGDNIPDTISHISMHADFKNPRVNKVFA